MTVTSLKHEFVSSVPDVLEDGVLYVSLGYRTVIHKCCCGCGHEVATPLSPTDWKLTFDGVSISLSPSIGNWSLACQSHYWIDRGSVKWADRWSDEKIAAGRAKDRRSKERYYDAPAAQPAPVAVEKAAAKPSRWARWFGWGS